MGILTKYAAAHFTQHYEAWRTNSSAEWSEYVENNYLRTERQVKMGDDGDWKVPIEVVGVWDTVGALGIPNWGWVEKLKLNEGYKFHRANLPGSKSASCYA